MARHIEALEPRQLFSGMYGVLERLDAAPALYVAPAVTNATPTGYSPQQIRHAYGFDQISFQNGALVGNGKGQTIAIVDAYDDPNIAADLGAFSTQFNLPAMTGLNGNPTFTKVTSVGRTSANAGWSLEMSLDVEWAHAVAPMANIVLVEARSSSLGDLLSAVDTARNRAGVAVVSMSWGAGEFSSETSYDSYFTTPARHNPVTYVASSGDTGAPLEWPAASPNVVAVGGTTLTLNSDNSIASESAWAGSGGGVSLYETQPTYQKGAVSAWSTTHRTGPDVAYDANPATGFAVYDTVAYSGQTGWFQVGGTSAGAPQWAAMVAIADQGRASAGKATLNGRTQTLPALYSGQASAFSDVVIGSSTGKPSLFATSGYDLVTGLGTPKAQSIAQQLFAST